jgi:hypothetical protein
MGKAILAAAVNRFVAAANLVPVAAFLMLGFQGLAFAQVPPCAVGCDSFHVPDLDPYTIGGALAVFGGSYGGYSRGISPL